LLGQPYVAQERVQVADSGLHDLLQSRVGCPVERCDHPVEELRLPGVLLG
jgi:hypothetical protein